MSTQPAPAWFARLPVSGRSGRRTVYADNNVLSNYLFETPTDDARFLFEDNRIQVHLSRQVIDEALNHPGLDVARRQQVWTRLGQLQQSGQVILSGTSAMTPPMLAAYRGLQPLLSRSGLSVEDAAVVADAVVKRVPLYTQERRSRTGLENALRNPAVLAYLRANTLPDTIALILVG